MMLPSLPKLPLVYLRRALWFLPARAVEKAALDDQAAYITIRWRAQRRSDAVEEALPLPDPDLAPPTWRLN